MRNSLLILFGKFIMRMSKTFNLGNGSTWPGHIALETNPKFIHHLLTINPKLKIILVAGTNGKTTTSKLIRFLLEKNGLRVFQNESGANLLNGVASTLIANADVNGKLNFDAAIFEIDENTLPLALKEIKHPAAIVLLNLFRDQLDRYGEVNSIAKKWDEALSKLIPNHANQGSTLNTHREGSTLIFANGDDPMLTCIAQESGLKTHFFGINESLMQKKEAGYDVDFLYCPKCGERLEYSRMSYSHMGIFKCPKKHFDHPTIEFLEDLSYPLFGKYNVYNTNAAAMVTKVVFGISDEKIRKTISDFKPAFGRQEVIEYRGKRIIILLSKNPTGFNQSIDAVLSRNKPFTALLILNDRIPDGRDISWIWDVDFEGLVEKAKKIVISGDRTYDMALRINYTQKSDIQNPKFEIQENLEQAIHTAVNVTEKDETLFILPTYSAMLDARKIISGRRIL